MQTQTPPITRARKVSNLGAPRAGVFSAAGICVVMAALYFLIGFRVMEVIDPTDDQAAFGFTAGVAFLVLAGVLFAFRRRIVWIGMALLQLFIAFTYFNLASERQPSFETWGMTLRVLQIPLVALLGYLIWQSYRPSDEPPPE